MVVGHGNSVRDAVAQAFAPRDVPTAKRLVLVLTAVATAVTFLFAVVEPTPAAGAAARTLGLGGPLTVLAVALLITVLPDPPSWLWFAYPLAATADIAVTDLATHDATLSGQVFFVFPVLFGGAQLQRRAAWVLSVLAVTGEVIVTARLLETRQAALDAGYMSAVLAATTGILVWNADRIDGLMATLRRQAAIDPLTGLVTRRVLDEAAAASLVSAAGWGGTALILVDIDHFKKINDEHGHLVGDLVLQQVARSLHAANRRTDVLSRMGGDELAILLPDCSLDVASDRAGRLVDTVRALRIDARALTMCDEPGHDELRVTVSLGLAHLPTHATSVHDLYRAADLSLYQAKRAGRDRVGLPAESNPRRLAS